MFRKGIEVQISELSEKYKWFLDTYNSLIKAIEYFARTEVEKMPIGEIKKYTKTNRKSTYGYSLYALTITYYIEKSKDAEKVYIEKVQLL
jgi:hypothetical protein